MANPAAPNNAEKNAQKFFKKAEQSDTLAKRSRKKERSDQSTKTAKLRELRALVVTAPGPAAARKGT